MNTPKNATNAATDLSSFDKPPCNSEAGTKWTDALHL